MGECRRAIRLMALVFFGGGLLFAAVAWFKGDIFYFRLATEALIFGGLALSVDLLLGKTGLLPLGQALFLAPAPMCRPWCSSIGAIRCG